MIEWLENLDRELFLFFNGLHTDTLDFLMWHISGKWEWIPLYAFLLYLLVKKYGKSVWVILLGVALLVTLADQISVKVFKEGFERWRPCHNLGLKDVVHLVNNKCGGRFGFVSSHAANSFALATFIGMLLNRKTLYALLLWAAVVSYSRIYLGVHYPSDVVGGALLGMVIATLLYKIVVISLKKIR